MNQTKKILIIFALIIFIGLGFAFWLISSKFDSEGLRKYAVQTVKTEYHRDLTISGDLKLQILPTIAIVANGIGLSNPDKFPVGQFIQADLVKINVAVLPLLYGNIQVEEVKAEGLVVNLSKTADGRNNWDFQVQANVSVKDSSNDSSNKGKHSLGLNIDRFDLVRSKLNYQDDRTHAIHLIEIPKASINQNGGKSNLDIAIVKNGVNLQIKGQVNSFEDLADIALDRGNPPINAQLKLLINQQSVDLNGSWLSSNAPSTVPVTINGSVKSNLIDLPVIQRLFKVDVQGGASTSSSHKSTKVIASGRIFNPEVINWSAMPSMVGNLKLEFQQLKVNDQLTLGPVVFDAQMEPNQIRLPNVKASMGGGQFSGAVQISGYQTTNPRVHFVGKGEGFSAQNLAALTGSNFRMSGGLTDFGLNLTGSGKSSHDFVSSMNGQAQVVIGSGRLAASKLNQSGDLLMSLIKVVDPRRDYSQTNLTCMVAYLPVKNGVISIQDSIGLETDQLYMLMKGGINLASETLVLDVKARDPSGITTGISIASLVQIQGSLANPQIGINKAGVAKQGLNIGLGVLTAGISILAENANSITDKSRPCQTATRPWTQVMNN